MLYASQGTGIFLLHSAIVSSCARIRTTASSETYSEKLRFDSHQLTR